MYINNKQQFESKAIQFFTKWRFITLSKGGRKTWECVVNGKCRVKWNHSLEGPIFFLSHFPHHSSTFLDLWLSWVQVIAQRNKERLNPRPHLIHKPTMTPVQACTPQTHAFSSSLSKSVGVHPNVVLNLDVSHKRLADHKLISQGSWWVGLPKAVTSIYHVL